jgi:hypothetical protein
MRLLAIAAIITVNLGVGSYEPFQPEPIEISIHYTIALITFIVGLTFAWST